MIRFRNNKNVGSFNRKNETVSTKNIKVKSIQIEKPYFVSNMQIDSSDFSISLDNGEEILTLSDVGGTRFDTGKESDITLYVNIYDGGIYGRAADMLMSRRANRGFDVDSVIIKLKDVRVMDCSYVVRNEGRRGECIDISLSVKAEVSIPVLNDVVDMQIDRIGIIVRDADEMAELIEFLG